MQTRHAANTPGLELDLSNPPVSPLGDAVLRERLALALRQVGPTPTVALDEPGLDLRVKLEYANGIGSLKDRPALWVLRRAIERGDVGPRTHIVESSSGNFALALAVLCRFLGLPFTAVVDPNLSPVYAQALQAHGAAVAMVSRRDDTGGFLKTRLEHVRALLADMPDAWWPNQYGNLDAAAAHYESTAGDIVRDLDHLDLVFIGVSTAGTIAGVSRRLKEHWPGVQVVAVDIQGSVIFGGAPAPRRLPGLGSSIRPPLLDQARIDAVMTVSEDDARAGCLDLLRRHGLFAGASTGAVYAAIGQYRQDHPGLARPRALFLAADRGSAYLDTVYGAPAAQAGVPRLPNR